MASQARDRVTISQGDKILLMPVAIMAHNEERSIKKAVNSALSQEGPKGYFVKVVVVANGCTDKTEEIVRNLEMQHLEQVVLLSIKEKGKTKAINRAITYFNELSKGGCSIPCIIFLDADCEFIGNDALINFMQWFEQKPELCAIGADCLPDVFFDQRKDIVAEIYRAIYGLGRFVRINSISGMCYGIRFDVLKKIEFPDFQFAEDMFVSARLDGWFLKDRNIQIVFKTPSNFNREISRRTRQEISAQRYHEYYSSLRNKRGKVKLLEGSLGEDFRWWGGASDDRILKRWLHLRGIKPKLLAGVYICVLLVARIRARRALQRLRKNSGMDYWKVTSR
ncbi:MAG: glycosyltransferase family 2 protein [Thermodesulfobacteriota bacterium]